MCSDSHRGEFEMARSRDDRSKRKKSLDFHISRLKRRRLVERQVMKELDLELIITTKVARRPARTINIFDRGRRIRVILLEMTAHVELVS